MYYIKKALLLFSLSTIAATGVAQQVPKQRAAGVYSLSFGTPDKFTPYSFCTLQPMEAALAQMPAGKLPFKLTDIKVRTTERGCIVEIPLGDEEQLYGFGLQQGSFNQRGLRKRPIVNDNPLNDLGYTHAPETFYVSTRGYSILINTSRYTTFYCGTTDKLKSSGRTAGPGNALSVKELYKSEANPGSSVTVDIPGAQGVEIFVFSGPDMRSAVERYNLFSGGGAMPAIWGPGDKIPGQSRFRRSASEPAG